MLITKASGKKEEFDKEKIKSTCRRAGAPEWLAEKIADNVRKKIREGATTKEILKATLSMLDKEMPNVAARYDLKGAIMRLGPAGFEFEKFISELLSRHGYETNVHNILNGKCISHEVDIVAKNGNEKIMIECKYHNAGGIYTGVRDVLYTKARFDDIVNGHSLNENFTNCQLVSNTKFSSEVIKYAKCMNILLLGWDYPKENIRTMLEKKKLYPITVIRGLSRNIQTKLINAGIVFCVDILDADILELSSAAGITKKQLVMLKNDVYKIIKGD